MMELNLSVKIQPHLAKQYTVKSIGDNAEELKAEVLKYAPEGAIWERSEQDFPSMQMIYYCGARWFEIDGEVMCRTGPDAVKFEEVVMLGAIGEDNEQCV